VWVSLLDTKSYIFDLLEKQYFIKESVTELCGKSIEEAGMLISLIHRGEIDKAKEKLSAVKKRLKKVEKFVSENKIVLRLSIIRDAKSEYVEAVCLFHLITKGELPKFSVLNVEPDEYILGLADLIGELRRRCLDLIRINRIDEATKVFSRMEELYLFVWSFEYPKKIVRGLRHKLDVDRRLLDDTRLILTQAHLTLKGK
jgi:translin